MTDDFGAGAIEDAILTMQGAELSNRETIALDLICQAARQAPVSAALLAAAVAEKERRVQELLEANNEYLARAREAEDQNKVFLGVIGRAANFIGELARIKGIHP